jgi:hypothetical protein
MKFRSSRVETPLSVPAGAAETVRAKSEEMMVVTLMMGNK